MKVKRLRELLINLGTADIDDDADIVTPIVDHAFVPIDSIQVETVEDWGPKSGCLPRYTETNRGEVTPGAVARKVLVVR